MCHDHSSAAVTFATKLIHSITIRDTVVEELQVALPKIADNLAARETTDGNDHLVDFVWTGEIHGAC